MEPTVTGISYVLLLELQKTTIFALPAVLPVTVSVVTVPDVEMFETSILLVFEDVILNVSLYAAGAIVSVIVTVAEAPTLTVDMTVLFSLGVTPVIEVTIPSAYVKYVFAEPELAPEKPAPNILTELYNICERIEDEPVESLTIWLSAANASSPPDTKFPP
jgi:hypothetical protein